MRAKKCRLTEELLENLLPGDRYGAPFGLLVYSLVCSETERAAICRGVACRAATRRIRRVHTAAFAGATPNL
jgi:hypothetical protein